jgi:putative membrane protein
MVEYEPKRWWSLVFSLRGTVLRGVATRVALATVVGGVAVALRREEGIAIPPLAHTLIGAALALLLVFRTNASYDRYWEGRRQLGTITNRTRDLCRQLSTVVALDAATRARLGRYLVAYYRLGAMWLRDERDLAALGDSLLPEERRAIEPLVARPFVVLGWVSRELAERVRDGALRPELLVPIERNFTDLVEALGSCDRIRRTPVPFAYAHHIKVFFALFCFTVPFAMVEAMGDYVPVASAVLSFALFGIDEIGVEIEDPFGRDPNDLPVDAIGLTIERTVDELLGVASPGGETST